MSPTIPFTFGGPRPRRPERGAREHRTHASTALITRGTTGIGLATARVLHEKGYGVLVTGGNPETLPAARRELPDVLSADVGS